MKKTIILLSIAGLMFAGLASAQTSAASADLGVSDPGLLPTNPFYFFKELGRNIQRAFTFNPIAKAELELKITNEKAAEAKKIQEIIPNNNDAIAKGIENYVAAQNKLTNSLESLKTASSTPAMEKVFDSVANNMVLHKKVLDDIGIKAGDSAEVKEAIKSATNQINDAAATTVLIIEGIKQNAAPEAVSSFENTVKTIISTVNPATVPVIATSTPANIQLPSAASSTSISKPEVGFCTKDYNPVCAQPPMPPCPEGSGCIQVMPALKTYSNECVAKSNNAVVQYKGECGGSTSEVLTPAVSTATADNVNCGKENEKLNRDALTGPINKLCCDGLKEDRSSKLYSVCVKPSETQVSNAESVTTGIANPASVYCVKQGYKNEIITNADGSQSGICIFNDGSRCDEWAYFRGECKPAAPASNATSSAAVSASAASAAASSSVRSNLYNY